MTMKLAIDSSFFFNHPEVASEINKQLAGWDPLGVGSFHEKGPYEEYLGYIPYVISVYVAKKSVYDFLLKLQIYLVGMVSAESEIDIEDTSAKIISILSKYPIEQLKLIIPNWQNLVNETMR